MATRKQIIDSLRKAYPDVDGCLLHSKQDEHVIDEPVLNGVGKKKKSVSNFTDDFTIPGFDINNPKHEAFSLLQIDGKLLSSDMYNIGQCDCAIISDEDLSLVEFKTDATTTNMNENCQKAESQIFFTCLRMQWALCQTGEDFLKLAKNIDGYICFNSYPKGNVDYQNRQLKFFKKTGISVYYNNKKTLS